MLSHVWMFACASYVVLFGADLYFSLMVKNAVNSTFSPAVQRYDLAAHFILYFLMGCSFFLARRPIGTAGKGKDDVVRIEEARRQGKKEMIFRLTVALFMCSFGLVMELCQATAWVNRSCTVDDGLANGLGVLAAAWLCPVLVVRKKGV